MPQTIGTPNPQNGSNNPYNPNTYTYNGNAVGAGQIYAAGSGLTIGSGITGISGITKADIDRMTIQPVMGLMELQWQNGDLRYTFIGEENNTLVKMVLTPENDMKPIEQFLLSTLIQACVARHILTHTTLLTYVRTHNLERHFRFSVA